MIRLPHDCVKPPIKVLNYQISCRLAFVLGFDQRIHKICIVNIFCITIMLLFCCCCCLLSCFCRWSCCCCCCTIAICNAICECAFQLNTKFSLTIFLLPFCLFVRSRFHHNIHFICLFNSYSAFFLVQNTVLNLSCIKMLLGNVIVSFDLRCTSSCFILAPFVLIPSFHL